MARRSINSIVRIWQSWRLVIGIRSLAYTEIRAPTSCSSSRTSHGSPPDSDNLTAGICQCDVLGTIFGSVQGGLLRLPHGRAVPVPAANSPQPRLRAHCPSGAAAQRRQAVGGVGEDGAGDDGGGRQSTTASVTGEEEGAVEDCGEHSPLDIAGRSLYVTDVEDERGRLLRVEEVRD